MRKLLKPFLCATSISVGVFISDLYDGRDIIVTMKTVVWIYLSIFLYRFYVWNDK